MKHSMTVNAGGTAGQGVPFSREVILGILDGAPDGYKLLARLVDDPCELLRDYDPSQGRVLTAPRNGGHTRTQSCKLEEQLRTWLVAALQQRQCWQALGTLPAN
jgi:hypothetical protein